MKIGFFTSNFPFKDRFKINNFEDDWGGVAEVVYQLSIQLEERGHKIQIFTNSPLNKKITKRNGDIKISGYKSTFKIGNTGIPIRMMINPKDYDLDLIHAHRGTQFAPLAGFLHSKIRNIPYVLTVHGITDYDRKFESLDKTVALNLFSKIYPEMIKRSSAVTALSEKAVNSCKYLKHADDLHIIPNGVNLPNSKLLANDNKIKERMGFNSSDIIILFVGSFVQSKNPDLLLKTFEELVHSYPHLKLVFLGEGPLNQKLRKYSKMKGLGDKVFFPGFVSGKKKEHYYVSADIFCLPSSLEGYPLTILEAASFKLPLLTSDLEVNKALVKDGHNGLIFEDKNAKSLTKALEHLIQNEKLRKKLGNNAQELAERYSWKKIVDRYEKIYLETCYKGDQ